VCVYAAVCPRHIDHIQAAPIHHIKRETPAETAIQPRERHKQRTCVCVAFLERRAPNGVPSNLAAKCSKNAAQMQQKCRRGLLYADILVSRQNSLCERGLYITCVERLMGFLQTWQQNVMQLALVAYGRTAHATQ
jgi:hypothetical protein